MNLHQLRDVLADEIYKLRSKKTKPQRTNAVCNAAGKILGSVRLEMDYCKMIGAKPSMKFIGASKALTLK